MSDIPENPPIHKKMDAKTIHHILENFDPSKMREADPITKREYAHLLKYNFQVVLYPFGIQYKPITMRPICQSLMLAESGRAHKHYKKIKEQTDAEEAATKPVKDDSGFKIRDCKDTGDVIVTIIDHMESIWYVPLTRITSDDFAVFISAISGKKMTPISYAQFRQAIIDRGNFRHQTFVGIHSASPFCCFLTDGATKIGRHWIIIMEFAQSSVVPIDIVAVSDETAPTIAKVLKNAYKYVCNTGRRPIAVVSDSASANIKAITTLLSAAEIYIIRAACSAHTAQLGYGDFIKLIDDHFPKHLNFILDLIECPYKAIDTRWSSDALGIAVVAGNLPQIYSLMHPEEQAFLAKFNWHDLLLVTEGVLFFTAKVEGNGVPMSAVFFVYKKFEQYLNDAPFEVPEYRAQIIASMWKKFTTVANFDLITACAAVTYAGADYFRSIDVNEQNMFVASAMRGIQFAAASLHWPVNLAELTAQLTDFLANNVQQAEPEANYWAQRCNIANTAPGRDHSTTSFEQIACALCSIAATEAPCERSFKGLRYVVGQSRAIEGDDLIWAQMMCKMWAQYIAGSHASTHQTRFSQIKVPTGLTREKVDAKYGKISSAFGWDVDITAALIELYSRIGMHPKKLQTQLMVMCPYLVHHPSYKEITQQLRSVYLHRAMLNNQVTTKLTLGNNLNKRDKHVKADRTGVPYAFQDVIAASNIGGGLTTQAHVINSQPLPPSDLRNPVNPPRSQPLHDADDDTNLIDPADNEPVDPDLDLRVVDIPVLPDQPITVQHPNTPPLPVVFAEANDAFQQSDDPHLPFESANDGGPPVAPLPVIFDNPILDDQSPLITPEEFEQLSQAHVPREEMPSYVAALDPEEAGTISLQLAAMLRIHPPD